MGIFATSRVNKFRVSKRDECKEHILLSKLLSSLSCFRRSDSAWFHLFVCLHTCIGATLLQISSNNDFCSFALSSKLFGVWTWLYITRNLLIMVLKELHQWCFSSLVHVVSENSNANSSLANTCCKRKGSVIPNELYIYLFIYLFIFVYSSILFIYYILLLYSSYCIPSLVYFILFYFILFIFHIYI